MTKVFVSGSIKIKKLDPILHERLDKIISQNFEVIVGDADGVDSSVQAYLKLKSLSSVEVYCSGDKPRNNLGEWSTRNVYTTHKEGSREFFTAKDKKMAEDCDYGLMIWDSKSTGTLSNVIELLKNNKLSLVFINREKEFITVKNVSDLEALVSHMDEASKLDANKKISLNKQLLMLKNSTCDMF